MGPDGGQCGNDPASRPFPARASPRQPCPGAGGRRGLRAPFQRKEPRRLGQCGLRPGHLVGGRRDDPLHGKADRDDDHGAAVREFHPRAGMAASRAGRERGGLRLVRVALRAGDALSAGDRGAGARYRLRKVGIVHHARRCLSDPRGDHGTLRAEPGQRSFPSEERRSPRRSGTTTGSPATTAKCGWP